MKQLAEHVENGPPEQVERFSRDFDQLRLIAEKDPMYEIHEQDRKDIWASRFVLFILFFYDNMRCHRFNFKLRYVEE